MSDLTVPELLAGSHRAHWLYQQNLPRMTAQAGTLAPSAGNAADARRALVEASDLRTQAHAADPEHLDQAWRDEAAAFPHDDLMSFYAQQIAKG